MAKVIQAAGSQSISRSAKTANLFFEMSIKGDYSATKTIAASIGSTLTFEKIPVNKQIYAEARAYKLESDNVTQTVLYTGTSNTIIVKNGNNTLAIAMQATGNGSGSGTGGNDPGTGGEENTPTSHTITYNLNGGTNANSNGV